MKYEKLADSLVSLLHGNNYKYKMYKGEDGKRTSNPYEARYFYISEPNMMFIIDESTNTLTIHKSNIPFDVFRSLHKTIRNLCKRYFINLEVKDYNSSFSPKDFSPTLLRKKLKIDRIKNESTEVTGNTLTEQYKKDNKTVDVYHKSDSMIISLNGNDGLTLPFINEDVIPLIIQHTLNENKIDSGFISALYKAHDVYSKIMEASKLRSLSKTETEMKNKFGKYFN